MEYSLSNRVLARFAAGIKRNSSLLLPSFGHFQSFQLCRRVCSRVAVWKDVVPCAGTVGELLQTFIFRCFCRFSLCICAVI